MLRDTAPLLYAALLAAVFWLAFLVMKPFLPGIVWAAVLVVTFRPLHDRLTKRFAGRSWLASTVVTTLVAAFIVVPIVIAAVQVIEGGVEAYKWTQTAYEAGGVDLGARERWPWVEDAMARAKELFGLADFDLKAGAIDAAKSVGGLIAAHAPKLLGATVGIVFSFIVMIFMMLVLFADGPRVADALTSVLPMPRADAKRIVGELGGMTRSVFISVGLTAFVQALLGAISFLVLGVGQAFTLSAAMFFSAILPGGTALVWLPVAIYLFVTGSPWKALIMVAWGAGVISTIDNVLRPFFARSGVKLPTALLVFGLFGGLLAFGLLGLFIGPVILYLVRELVGILRREVYGETGA
jgi:predicted PurR-regulated permease PerM